MKVGIFIGEIQPDHYGGGSTFQTSVLQELLKNDNKNHHFVFFYYGNYSIENSKQNATFVKLTRTKIVKKKSFFKKKHKEKTYKLDINEEAEKHKIELMWFFSPDSTEVNIPFVLTIWDLQHRLQPYFPEVSVSGWTFSQRESFYSNIIPKASYIAIGNNEGARQVNQFYNYPYERIKTISMPTPNYVYELKGDEDFINKNNLVRGQYLFYPAQFWPHKNHITILNAFKILIEKDSDFKNFKIVFTGSNKGNEEYIKQKTKDLDLESYVNFLGFVSREQIISLYQNAFSLVYSSMFGPDNIPPLEAMALNCPVICSNAKGMEEQLQDCALFFNPTNHYDLVDKIIQLKNDVGLSKDIQLRGLELARKVNSTNYVKKMIEIMDEFSSIRQMWSSDKPFIHL